MLVADHTLSVVALAIAVGGTACALVLGCAALLLARERPRTSQIRTMLRESNAPIEVALGELSRSVELVRQKAAAPVREDETIGLEEIASQVVDAARRICAADAAAILVESEEGNDPYVATSGMQDRSTVNPAALRLRSPGARAVTVQYGHHEAVVNESGVLLRAGLAVPLAGHRGKVAGALSVFWRGAGGDPSEEQVAALERLARRAIHVIEEQHDPGAV